MDEKEKETRERTTAGQQRIRQPGSKAKHKKHIGERHSKGGLYHPPDHEGMEGNTSTWD